MNPSQELNCEISCFKLPPDLLDKDIAKQHFKQFGRILKMSIRLKSKSCLVLYAEHSSAAHALVAAGNYDGEQFIVQWAKPKDRLITKKVKPKKGIDPDWSTDPEVKSELQAMGELIPKSYNLRPERMVVDTPELIPIKKIEKPKLAVGRWKLKETKVKAVENLALTTNVTKFTPEMVELYKIIKQQATTVEDKYRILEARDKLIRLRTKKQSDLKKATRTIGTCPDMCPEKERLMREVQHQVALYEQDSGGREMNHSLAVKQYSRSSADQETPLPHELRPVNVLHLTMGYMLHNIMDLCIAPGVNLAEWYHFVWDRTRAIRKDITQQELCCLGSVELVEQCARFHIHCSARLVAEEPSVFDQKINSENLTKCLQSLKYMYQDLAIKNIRCQNEAEFRAYIVLLNLNDGNFMWEVQNLSEEIKKSPQMRFALQVYSALDKNNYVKFFKLVRSTTYLNACILLRYFIQVRSKAINLILKCYAPPRTQVQFPVEELTNLLAFEDNESTMDFMEYYGLGVNETRSHIIFGRTTYMTSDMPYLLERAIIVIESKRICTVGETICGKTLPPRDFEKHVVHNSFDSDGFLILSKFFSDSEIPAQEIEKPKVVEEKDVKVAKEKVSNIFSTKKSSIEPKVSEVPTSIFTTSKNIFVNTTNASILRTGTTKIDDVKKSSSIPSIWGSKTTSSVFNPILQAPSIAATFNFPEPEVKDSIKLRPVDSSHPSFTFQSSKSVDFGEQQRNVIEKSAEAKLPNIFSSNKSVFSKPAIANIPLDTKFSMQAIEHQRKLEEERRSKQMLEQERKDRERLQELKRKEEEKRKQEEELRRKQEEEERILREKLLEQKKRRELEKQKLEELEIYKTVVEVLNNAVNAVCEFDRQRREVEKVLTNLAEKAERRKMLLVVEKWKKYVSHRKRKRKIMEESPAWLPERSISEEANELFTESQTLTLHCSKRYKLGKPLELDLPKEKNFEKLKVHEIIYSILTKKFSELHGKIQREMFWKISIKSQGAACRSIKKIIEWKKVNNQYRLLEHCQEKFNSLTYCIENQVKTGKDINGLIYVMNNLDEGNEFDETEFSVPIAVIVRSKSCEYDETANGNRVFIDRIGSMKSLANAFKDALQWLATKVQNPPPLELDLLHTYLQKNLTTELWERVHSYAKRNFAFNKCLQNPNIAINLHNEAIERLKNIIIDKSNLTYVQFPTEFKKFLKQKVPLWLPCDYKYFPANWRSAEYRHSLEKIMDSLKLPEFHNKWPGNENDLESTLLSYCEAIFTNPTKPFYKIMAVILKNITNDFKTDIQNVSWADVVNVLVEEKLISINYEFTCDENSFGQYYVIYQAEKLQMYQNEVWFYKDDSVVASKIQEVLRKQNENVFAKSASPKRKSLDFDVDLNKVLEETYNSPINDKNEILSANKQLSEIKFLLEDLEESIGIQKLISDRFEKTVNTVLQDKY